MSPPPPNEGGKAESKVKLSPTYSSWPPSPVGPLTKVTLRLLPDTRVSKKKLREPSV